MTTTSPTPTPATVPFVPVTQEDIYAFGDKLARWGATLSPKEQALVQTILERARLLEPDDVKQQQLRAGFSAALLSIYQAAAQAWGADEGGWVRIDPVWYKAGATDDSEQIEVTFRIAAEKSPPASTTAAPAPATAALSPGAAATAARLPVSGASVPPTSKSATGAAAAAPAGAGAGPAGTTAPRTKG